MFKQVWMTALTASRPTDIEGAGQLRFDEKGNMYRWVKNATGSAAVAGDVAFYGVALADGLALKEVYLLNQAGRGTAASQMAGAWMANVASGEYGWIQIQGYNPAVNVLGHASLAIGVSLKGVNDQKYVTFDTAVGTAPTIGRHMVACEAYTTATAALKKVFIRCL